MSRLPHDDNNDGAPRPLFAPIASAMKYPDYRQEYCSDLLFPSRVLTVLVGDQRRVHLIRLSAASML